ncbi:TIGR01777 family oxidoreductase [Desulfoluna sp.]|uniref:TIGR01777 family oxidoreductase n=1 Tax=Desulfoluna sp. TaxID=2045199 RepID=UPI002607DCD5|nr:TIGR01777 family oxidoreductase [Desulfoluna sp.]
MNVLITGGTGFIGTVVATRLLSEGHEVAVTGRSGLSSLIGRDRFRTITCDTTVSGTWQEEVARSAVVINLAGRTIFTRWNEAKKADILEGRLLTTENVVNAMSTGAVLLSASAVGFYGDRGDTLLAEEDAGGDGFLADVCKRWEAEAMAASAKGVRVVIMRFGGVLGQGGGALGAMLTPYKMGLGGPLASGEQWFPWIHMDDLVTALIFLMGHDSAEGPVNFCAPYVVRNKEFSKTLAAVLGRPAPFTVPLFALRMAMGELADEIIASQRVVPEKLSSWGFSFAYPSLEGALKNILQGE